MTTDSQVTRLALPVGARDHALGPATAAVTLVEYSDFACLDCGQAYAIVKEVHRRMGDRLRVVFRHFPLTQTDSAAQHAAEAAEAAAAQGKFWEMHDLLFEQQRRPCQSGHALDDGQLERYVAMLGISTVWFENQMMGSILRRRVQEDVQSGVHSGVTGTPTFFINGVRHDSGHDLATLLAAIERAEREARGGRNSLTLADQSRV